MCESALNQLDFNMAERCFVKCSDFVGIHFIKRIQKLDVRMLITACGTGFCVECILSYDISHSRKANKELKLLLFSKDLKRLNEYIWIWTEGICVHNIIHMYPG